MRPSRERRSPAAGWYVAWAIVGAGVSLSLLGAMTIGIFVAPIVLLAAIALVAYSPARGAFPGVVCGLGVPPLYVAWLNRDGPGTICTVSGGGESCVDEWSPWPWVAVTVFFIAGGVALCLLTRRSRRLLAPAPRTSSTGPATRPDPTP